MPAPCPCINYPFIKNFREYFNIFSLIQSFLIAFIYSTFLFLELFGFKNPLLYSTFALLGVFLFLQAKRVFWIGFFIGILWFWWIGLSFRYYDLPYLIPLIILLIGLIYGALFAIIASLIDWIFKRLSLFSTPLRNALLLFSLFYIHPFSFHWLIPNLSFLDTPFGLDKHSFALILIAFSLFLSLKGKKRYFALLLLPFALHSYKDPPLAPLKIELVTTHVPQEKKWLASYQTTIIQQNLSAIKEAIKKGADIVILPESAYPLFLDERAELLEQLLILSHHIAIITGALHYKQGKVYNSTYVFEQGNYIILNKVFLVPFGEEIPLPNPLKEWINEIFFDGASDYSQAKEPQIYTIKDINFTNAICYEATHPLLFQTNTPYMIAISNNAWFLPSYEPVLQNSIIKYYAKIHKKVVYHATNIKKTEVIR